MAAAGLVVTSTPAPFGKPMAWDVPNSFLVLIEYSTLVHVHAIPVPMVSMVAQELYHADCVACCPAVRQVVNTNEKILCSW